MQRLVVLLAVCAASGALALVACGGGDKPPLTPDTVDTSVPTDSADAGPATPPPAKPK